MTHKCIYHFPYSPFEFSVHCTLLYVLIYVFFLSKHLDHFYIFYYIAQIWFSKSSAAISYRHKIFVHVRRMSFTQKGHAIPINIFWLLIKQATGMKNENLIIYASTKWSKTLNAKTMQVYAAEPNYQYMSLDTWIKFLVEKYNSINGRTLNKSK